MRILLKVTECIFEVIIMLRVAKDSNKNVNGQIRLHLNFGELVSFLIDSHHNLAKGKEKGITNRLQVYTRKYKQGTKQ